MMNPGSQPVISVVIICNHNERRLSRVINSAFEGAVDKEVILVLADGIDKKLLSLPVEDIKVVLSGRQGRGYACYSGAIVARGRIILFLHADTVLPLDWDNQILMALEEAQIMGGAFSIAYDPANWFLRNVSPYINIYSRLFKEVWGDRGIFIRKECLMPHLNKLLVPLMEDIILSQIIVAYGKMVILRQKVITSADTFREKGYWKHIGLILLYRILYSFGVSENRLYKWYYGINLTEFPKVKPENKPILKLPNR